MRRLIQYKGSDAMGNSPGSPSGARPPYAEQRQSPRYSLIVNVDILEPASDVHMSGRVSEISRKGCYVDILNPLPVGTLIFMTIFRDVGTFASKGKIIYLQQGMGMGVAFQETAPDQLKILDSWLAELAQ
jgi:PilZ domain